MSAALVRNRSLALVLAFTICLSTTSVASAAKAWIPIVFLNGSRISRVDVTMDGLKTIGKNTTGGFVTGSAAGATAAGAAAAGIVSAPATPLAYGVPVLAGTIGGFLKGISDALWDGNLRVKW